MALAGTASVALDVRLIAAKAGASQSSPSVRNSPHLARVAQCDSPAARKEGMRPLRLSAAMHVARGITTIEEVLGVLPLIE